MKRCLGYFETASQNEFYEFTNTELILEAMDV
jgi:hypothetical protein